MLGAMSPTLSIVVPCFNEADVIRATHARLTGALTTVLAPLGEAYEILYINDGSRDSTHAILAELAAQDPCVRLINFARNFGHQAAVSAGLEYSSGAAVVIIDADLQDPPELIGEMMKKWREGFDVVYGQRIARAGETAFKKFTASLFYRLLNSLSDTDIPQNVGDFRLIDRRVARIICQMPERHRFLRGMISWVGFRQTPLPYSRQARFAGHTKYPLRKMLHFASDGVISFSTVPLKISVWLGLFCACLAVILIGYAAVVRLLTSHWVSGWAFLSIAFAFFSGVQLVAMGVIGSYVGRIFEETKKRPLFVIEGLRGFDGQPAPLSVRGLAEPAEPGRVLLS